MPLPRGRTLPFTLGRRIVADIMHFSRPVAQVSVEREIRVPEVAAAREAANPRVGWYPILLKAYSLAAAKVPELRRSLLTVPYTRLYEHACSVAAVTVEREVGGEPVVLTVLLRSPESKPLTEIDARLRWAKTAPVGDVPDFRRTLLHHRFPRPARRLLMWLGLRASGSWRQRFAGTFGSSSVVTAGACTLFARCPLTTMFTFTPLRPDGTMTLRLGFDHRVVDGGPTCRGLVETEAALRGEILAELRALAPAPRLAV